MPLFPPNHTECVGLADHGLPPGPLLVRIDLEGEIDVYSNTDPTASEAGAVRLVLDSYDLTRDVDRDLAEVLAALPGVRPAEVVADNHITVEVPIIAPDVVEDYLVTWTVTDELSVTHTDRVEAYLELPAEPRRMHGKPCVDLTPAQTWHLVRVLTSLQYWQFQLQAEFAGAATVLRKDMQRVGSSRFPLLAMLARYVRFGRH